MWYACTDINLGNDHSLPKNQAQPLRLGLRGELKPTINSLWECLREGRFDGYAYA